MTLIILALVIATTVYCKKKAELAGFWSTLTIFLPILFLGMTLLCIWKSQVHRLPILYLDHAISNAFVWAVP